ncbi:MAG: phospholipid carrier-dependent glycosyltransferase [Chloroflexota bacterium]
MNSKTQKTFFEKYEFIIPLALFIIFLIFTLPGISWGAPDGWHPDEIVGRSIKALHGEWQFSETNFDYPDLPQYAMFWLGKIVLALGKTDTEVIIASRVLSAVLAGLTVVLTYMIARRISDNIYIAGLSGLLLICVSEMSHNGRFAHNDTFLVFFTTLAVLCAVEYFRTQNKIWLYASLVAVGSAASCKYIGGSLVIMPFTVYLIGQRHNLRKQPLAIAETLFIGSVLTFLGYAVGTPKALFWMTYYFKRVFAALQWQISYGKQPGSVRGILGQYSVMANGLGLALVLLFGAAFIWAGYQFVKSQRSAELKSGTQMGQLGIMLLAILVLDLPMLISYNYQLRYFLTLMPLLAVLAAFFVEALYVKAKQIKTAYAMLVSGGIALIVLYSLARILSLMLLVMNDARIPASKFLETLPLGTSLEETYYPPSIPPGHFKREHNYPIYFQKEGEPLPTNKNYVFNVGEVGLDQRQTDYLITDSFTWEKFNDPYVCSVMQVECDFFKQLASRHSNHYKLLKEFSYTLPVYLPQIGIGYVNPSIRIYERIK